MKYVVLILTFLISIKAQASSCSSRLETLGNPAGLILSLAKENKLTESTIQKILNQETLSIKDFEFKNMNETQKNSYMSALNKLSASLNEQKGALKVLIPALLDQNKKSKDAIEETRAETKAIVHNPVQVGGVISTNAKKYTLNDGTKVLVGMDHIYRFDTEKLHPLNLGRKPDDSTFVVSAIEGEKFVIVDYYSDTIKVFNSVGIEIQRIDDVRARVAAALGVKRVSIVRDQINIESIFEHGGWLKFLISLTERAELHRSDAKIKYFELNADTKEIQPAEKGFVFVSKKGVRSRFLYDRESLIFRNVEGPQVSYQGQDPKYAIGRTSSFLFFTAHEGNAINYFNLENLAQASEKLVFPFTIGRTFILVNQEFSSALNADIYYFYGSFRPAILEFNSRTKEVVSFDSPCTSSDYNTMLFKKDAEGHTHVFAATFDELLWFNVYENRRERLKLNNKYGKIYDLIDVVFRKNSIICFLRNGKGEVIPYEIHGPSIE